MLLFDKKTSQLTIIQAGTPSRSARPKTVIY